MRWVERSTGAFLVALGLVVLSGWWLHNPSLVQLGGARIGMVPNTALCFVLLGACLVIGPARPSGTVPTLVSAAGLVAAVTLLQQIIGIDFGTDRWLASIWLKDANPQPGRMAPQTCLAMLAGAAVLGLARARFHRLGDALVQTLLLLMAAVGLIGIAGYALGLTLLYGWYQYTAMALASAVGVLVMAVGLWCAWAPRRRARSLADGRLTVAGLGSSTLVMGGILTLGLCGFVILASQTEVLLTGHLHHAARAHSRIVSSEIDAAIEATDELMAGMGVVDPMAQLNTLGAQPTVQRALQAQVERNLGLRTKVISLHGLDGKVLAKAGGYLPASDFNAELGPEISLRWHDGFYLHRVVPLSHLTQPVGFAELDIKLPRLSSGLAQAHDLGKSAEAGLCAHAGAEKVQCAPTRHLPRPFTIARVVDGMPLPVSHALDGQEGSVRALDYRRVEVLAAFKRVEPYRLGLVVKIDSSEFNAPVRQQFQNAMGLLSLFVFTIAWLMRGTPGASAPPIPSTPSGSLETSP
ncbi:MAG: hypothetical protein V4739_12530 [Pseudomonadota bacterium]